MGGVKPMVLIERTIWSFGWMDATKRVRVEKKKEKKKRECADKNRVSASL